MEFTYNNMTKLPEGKNRLDLVREGLGDSGLKKRGRLVVGIDRLKEDPKNERRTFRNMDGLIASIKGVGLIEPITVTARRTDRPIRSSPATADFERPRRPDWFRLRF
jgi:hypothetical protein